VGGAVARGLQAQLDDARAAAQRASEEAAEANAHMSGKERVLDAQRKVFQEQDTALDGIAEQLARVRQIGGTINTEVDSQNRLLDDMEGNFEAGNDIMTRTAEQAERTVDNSSTWRLKLIIFALLAILVVLILL